MLTSDECARIVHASIDPSRILAGIDGYNGSPPDVLLTVVAKIKADAVTAARAEVRGKIEALAKQMKPGLSIPPLDCTNACMDSDCDCSGDFRPVSWSGVTPDDLRALVADLGGDHA